MPKSTMSAGREFETLNKAELDASLKEWMVDVVKGIRPIALSTQGTADSTGAITLGGATTVTGGAVGPREGYWWSVCRLAVRVDGSPASYSLYRNAPNVDSLVRDIPAGNNGYVAFSTYELMLGGGDSLVFQASGVTPNTSLMTVSGQAVEIPNQLLWKWMAG